MTRRRIPQVRGCVVLAHPLDKEAARAHALGEREHAADWRAGVDGDERFLVGIRCQLRMELAGDGDQEVAEAEGVGRNVPQSRLELRVLVTSTRRAGALA